MSFRDARNRLHNLAGLLTGVSAAAYCAAHKNCDPAMESYLAKIGELAGDAQSELAELRSIILALQDEPETASS